MQHSFFKETAEEMVDRLCKKWAKEKIFASLRPITDPTYKSLLVRGLKLAENHQNPKSILNYSKKSLKLWRENILLLEVAKLYAIGYRVTQIIAESNNS